MFLLAVRASPRLPGPGPEPAGENGGLIFLSLISFFVWHSQNLVFLLAESVLCTASSSSNAKPPGEGSRSPVPIADWLFMLSILQHRVSIGSPPTSQSVFPGSGFALSVLHR